MWCGVVWGDEVSSEVVAGRVKNARRRMGGKHVRTGVRCGVVWWGYDEVDSGERN